MVVNSARKEFKPENMNKLKENLKDIFTDLIGASIILAALYLFFYAEEIDLTKFLIMLGIGCAFFFIPDDILSQMVQKFVGKKLDKKADE